MYITLQLHAVPTRRICRGTSLQTCWQAINGQVKSKSMTSVYRSAHKSSPLGSSHYHDDEMVLVVNL